MLSMRSSACVVPAMHLDEHVFEPACIGWLRERMRRRIALELVAIGEHAVHVQAFGAGFCLPLGE